LVYVIEPMLGALFMFGRGISNCSKTFDCCILSLGVGATFTGLARIFEEPVLI